MIGKKFVCFGEVLLRLSAPGKELLLQSPRLDAHIGGAEANVAVSLRKLGHRTHMVTALPDSPLGRACADELRRHGVDIDAVRYRDGRMGLYFLTHAAGSRPAEVLYDRSLSAFATAPADLFDWPALLAGTTRLHVSGITPAVSDSAARAVLLAVKAARRAGVQVSFDCNFRARLWGTRSIQAPRLLSELCEHADLIFADERDIALIFGFTTTEPTSAAKRRRAADTAFAAWPELKFMASTERILSGAQAQLSGVLQTRTQTFVTRAHPLTEIVDRIGAGDAFAAGVLHGLESGLDPQACVNFGAAAASLKHSVPGDFNLLGKEAVELLLSDRQMDVRR